MRIAIVGGGASGLMAAITAAGYAKALAKEISIVVLEGGAKCGKKLLSTGNGHCNLTNKELSVSDYHSDSTTVLSQVLDRFSMQDCLNFFQEIGIPTVVKDGYVYPRSREAAAVREALVAAAKSFGVEIRTDAKVHTVNTAESLLKKSAGEAQPFTLHTDSGEIIKADRVILACGGMAFPKSGSDGSGYELAMDLGHSLIQPLPALVALTAQDSFCKNLAGVRIEGSASLLVDGIRKRTEQGELQLTDYGASGIPVFQLSGDAVEALLAGKSVQLVLNFWDSRSETDVLYELKQRIKRHPDWESGELLRGIIPDKMIPVLLKLSGIELHIPVETVAAGALAKLAHQLTALSLHINGAKDFDSAQVTRGGVPLNQVDRFLQSKTCKGLFLAGEILNVDGRCGGYNLQWAWSSGFVAGEAAVRQN